MKRTKQEPNPSALDTIRKLLQRAQDELTPEKRRECLETAHVILSRMVGSETT